MTEKEENTCTKDKINSSCIILAKNKIIKLKENISRVSQS